MVSDKDFNGDAVNDVVLFNKNGDPVIINGFGLASSEYPYRKSFYEANDTKIKRMRAGGYNNWVRKSFVPEH